MTLIEHIRAGRPVTTRDGLEVVIHTTKGRQTGFPVIGEYWDSRGEWWLCSWTADGLPVSGISEMTLIPAPEPERTVYVNIYGDSITQRANIEGPFVSAYIAQCLAGNNALAAAVPLTFRPGQGIEGRTG